MSEIDESPTLPEEQSETGNENTLSPEKQLVDETFQFMTSFGSQIETNSQPDTIFFLLKSAVPVARMVKQLWPALYPDTPIPNIRYINIGREIKSEVEYSYNFKTFQAGKTYSPPSYSCSRN